MNESEKNINALWRSQATAGIAISADEMRQRAVRSRMRENRERVIRIGAVSVWILTTVLELLFLAPVDPLRGWLNGVKLLSIVVWFAFSGPQALERPLIIGLDLGSRLGATSCMDFYRKQLLERRDRLRRQYKGVPILGVFAVAFTVFGARYRELAMIFGALLIVVLAVLYLRLRREYPRVQTELEELDAFARIR
jgi:hypothetical protein